MNPQVSVILCSYNQGSYLPEAIESVLAQTFRDWELLLIDNGSTDSSPEIARRYGSHPKIRLFLHRENRPIVGRFNEAIREARGPFVSFLYSDDLYLPHKLESQLSVFSRLPTEFGVVYAPSRFRNQRTGREWQACSLPISGPALETLLLQRGRCYPDMISPLTRRECLLRHPFDDRVFGEGEAIFLKIALTHHFHMDPNPVAVSRDTGENRGRAIPVNVGYHLKTLERIEADPAFDRARFGGILQKHRALLWRDNAYAFARMGGDLGWIRSALRQAAGLWPAAGWSHKWFYAWLLTCLGPHRAARINRWVDIWGRTPYSRGLVAGYGGSSGN